MFKPPDCVTPCVHSHIAVVVWDSKDNPERTQTMFFKLSVPVASVWMQVRVTRGFLKGILDHLDRAEQAAQHATAISSSARTAFEDCCENCNMSVVTTWMGERLPHHESTGTDIRTRPPARESGSVSPISAGLVVLQSGVPLNNVCGGGAPSQRCFGGGSGGCQPRGYTSSPFRDNARCSGLLALQSLCVLSRCRKRPRSCATAVLRSVACLTACERVQRSRPGQAAPASTSARE